MLSDDYYSKIISELKRISLKIDSMIKLNEEMLGMQREFLRFLNKSDSSSFSEETRAVPDATALFSLPNSLRKTVLALYKLGEATAEDLSNETERLRAVESAYANQLTRLGYLKKKRLGRKVYFYIKNNLGE